MHAGLQVRQPGGEWTNVAPATENACRVAVLVGAQLERATGGALRAVEHRVVATPGGSNLPRVSLVFKLRCRHDAQLAPLALADKIDLEMPFLLDPQKRRPISVAAFEREFAFSHPSIFATPEDLRLEDGDTIDARVLPPLQLLLNINQSALLRQQLPPAPPETTRLWFGDWEGRKLLIAAAPKAKLRAVFQPYIQDVGISINDAHLLRFLLDGDRLDEDKTVEWNKLQDGDIIDVMMQQGD